jgi:hypothetical protein
MLLVGEWIAQTFLKTKLPMTVPIITLQYFDLAIPTLDHSNRNSSTSTQIHVLRGLLQTF